MTNFDELIEEAFRDADVALDPVDVHTHAPLPSFHSVRAHRSLIKLHGGRYGLRADYTLDMAPTSEEQENFHTYFLDRSSQDPTGRSPGDSNDAKPEDGKGNASKKGESSPELRNHVIVIGMSASDCRILQMLVETQKAAKHCMKIFWVCYTAQNEEYITKILQKRGLKKLNLDEEPANADQDFDFATIRTQFTGLFLLQLWQELTYTLPPKFAPFPSVTRINTPPALLTTQQINNLNRLVDAGVDECGNKILKQWRDTFHSPRQGSRRLLRLTAEANELGVVSKAMHHYYRAIDDGCKCVWLSLENIGLVI